MVLIVQSLAIARAGVAVLENLSFALGKGRGLILRGPNGIGKTTLLRTIAGLQEPLAGRIEVATEDLAYASHADGVKSRLTVRENLEFWAAVHGTRDVAGAIEALNLRDLSDRFAGNLSAGQRRRLGLARLLVSGQSLWLMDEPTISLDAASVALFAQVVTRHLAAGGSALMATHIDLGITADVLDLGPFKARAPVAGGLRGAFDEALT